MKRIFLSLLLFSPLGCGPQPTAPQPISSLQASTSAAFAEPELQSHLFSLLEKKYPIKRHANLVSLAEEHAQQLAQDSENTEFKTQNYTPLAPSPLMTRLLKLNFFASDNLASAILSDKNKEQALSRFEQQMQSSLGISPFTHYGVGAAKRNGIWFISTILATEIVQIQGIQLHEATPVRRTFRGKITADGYHSPSVLITQPNGEVMTLPLRINGKSFELDIPFDQKGYYSFEVNVEGPLGPQPATNFTIAVAVPQLTPEPTDISPAAPITNLEATRLELLQLLNRDRTALGLAPVQLLPSLNQAAQNHSQDMVKNQFIGHYSPTLGSPQQQAAAVGVSDVVAQNIAISRNPSNSQIELMSSPGHRQIMINPAHTHVGFGAVNGPDGFLYITQLFTHQQLLIDPLPHKLKAGESFILSGKSLNKKGFLGIFQDKTLLMPPQDLSKNPDFQIQLRLSGSGKTQLTMGISPGPNSNGNFTFDFANVWDITVE